MIKLPRFINFDYNISFKEKIILASIIVLVIMIPSGAYLLSLRAKTQSQASDYNTPVTSPKPIKDASGSSRLQQALDKLDSQGRPLNVSPTDSEGATLLLGATMGFKLIIEARPTSDYSTQAFLGIAQGSSPVANPKYLLSFMLDIPATGVFTDLSLAGLTDGETYVAYIKGASQLATSSAFTARIKPIDLGMLQLTTGDVNDDNVINTADYDIVKALLGTNVTSPNWNPNLDFNLDNVINTIDLNIIRKNLSLVGASGPWFSGIPQASSSATSSAQATSSGSLNPQGKEEGYWMWIPEL